MTNKPQKYWVCDKMFWLAAVSLWPYWLLVFFYFGMAVFALIKRFS